MYEFLRNIFASEQPVMERFNIVDPAAVGNNVRSMSLAYTPATSDSLQPQFLCIGQNQRTKYTKNNLKTKLKHKTCSDQ